MTPREIRASFVWLPAEAVSVPLARRFTTAVVKLWKVGGELLEDAELVVSELVGNATTHGRCDLTVRLRLDANGLLHITVVDRGDEPESAASPPTDDEHARGMHIIQALAARMYVTRQSRSRHTLVVLTAGNDGADITAHA
ncbi:ATP-binding protein [Streptomyces sp. NPDC096323]|uniref:ATP-binding protein n=1 Tax=Streptomyces sp. NPDC096323 TaxID=3155822 RepID=UPI003333E56C